MTMARKKIEENLIQDYMLIENLIHNYKTIKFKCVMSAQTKEELIKKINEHFRSDNYIITDDGLIYNTKTKRALDCLYLEKRNRHCVYSVEEI